MRYYAIFSHANELFDQEFENSVLVSGLHLSQLLELSDLDYVRILLELLLL